MHMHVCVYLLCNTHMHMYVCVYIHVYSLRAGNLLLCLPASYVTQASQKGGVKRVRAGEGFTLRLRALWGGVTLPVRAVWGGVTLPLRACVRRVRLRAAQRFVAWVLTAVLLQLNERKEACISVLQTGISGLQTGISVLQKGVRQGCGIYIYIYIHTYIHIHILYI